MRTELTFAGAASAHAAFTRCHGIEILVARRAFQYRSFNLTVSGCLQITRSLWLGFRFCPIRSHQPLGADPTRLRCFQRLIFDATPSTFGTRRGTFRFR